MSYDPESYDLAYHFYPDASEKFACQVAQAIQDAAESFNDDYEAQQSASLKPEPR